MHLQKISILVRIVDGKGGKWSITSFASVSKLHPGGVAILLFWLVLQWYQGIVQRLVICAMCSL